MEYTTNNRCWCVRLVLSEWVLAWWWRLVASRKAMTTFIGQCDRLTYWCFAMATKMASKVGACFHCCLLVCHLGGCRDDTKQVAAQWWRPVASGVALDMLHWVMRDYCFNKKWEVAFGHARGCPVMFATRVRNSLSNCCHKRYNHYHISLLVRSYVPYGVPISGVLRGSWKVP